MSILEDDLEDLETAEDFLNYFEVPYEPSVVQVYRLHILQKFHNNMEKQANLPSNDVFKRAIYKEQLEKAYQTFVSATAQDEKLFKVFKDADQKPAFVPLEALLGDD